MNNPKDHKNLIHVPSLIISSAAEDADDPFINFQTNPPAEELTTRHYFESIAATTEVNQNLYEFLPEALEMISEGFKQRKMLTINHDKGLWSNTVGYGATVDAVVVDNKLYVASYLSLNKTYPRGPFGSSEELRDGIVDGFIANVSQSVTAQKARCSVCGQPYPVSSRDYYNESYCRHYRGQQLIVVENGKEVIKTVHVIIEAATATELSIVGIPADTGSGITKKQINFSLSDFFDEDRFNHLYGEGSPPPIESNPEGIDTGIDPSKQDDKDKGEKQVSNETLNAMKERAETAEQNAARLRVEAETAKSEKVAIESQMTVKEAELKSAAVEKASLQTQVEALTTERDALKSQAEQKDKDIESKDAKIQKLEQEALENKVVIADGIAARKKYEEAYLDAYVAAMGDACTEEDRELQAETAKAFPMEVLEKKTEGFLKSAGKNYPTGKTVNSGKEGGEGSEEEQEDFSGV